MGSGAQQGIVCRKFPIEGSKVGRLVAMLIPICNKQCFIPIQTTTWLEFTCVATLLQRVLGALRASFQPLKVLVRALPTVF